MSVRGLAVLLPVYVFATACGGATTPASPSQVQLPTPATVTIAVSGSVRNSSNNAGLSGADVQVTTGPDASRSTTTDASGNYSLAGLKVGLFTVRFSRQGFEILERPLNVASDTRLDVVLRPGASCIATQPPTNFRAVVAGTRVTFTWDPVANATNYLIVVGTSPGSSNVMSTNITLTTHTWRGAPIGTLYSRVFARNDCPHDAASPEITFTVVG